MTTDKELKEIYNFYKDCKEGFVTGTVMLLSHLQVQNLL